jgi:enterochelin esterase-like enzyme
MLRSRSRRKLLSGCRRICRRRSSVGRKLDGALWLLKIPGFPGPITNTGLPTRHYGRATSHGLLYHPSARALGNRGSDERALHSWQMRGIMKRTFWGLAILVKVILLGSFMAAAAPAQTSPPPLISPDVHADKSVTFRFRAPNDKEVAVSIEGLPKPIPMVKDDQGVWSVTTEPLAPDYYGYSFIADGVGLFDPSNHAVKPNFLYRASEVHVPGPALLSWEIAAVPHGEIHHHFYKSGVVGDDRGYYVYTPPGYDSRGKQTYPVLYLLHGFSDDASAWTAVGRANVILDNLIAQGKAKPMLVVMPLGYGAPEVLLPNSGVWRDRAITERNFNKFREALLTEVLPRVEAEYPVIKDRNSRAIAGLSMGGSESLLTGLNTLDKFGWIGAFSSGGITEEFDKEFPGLDAKATEQLHLLWIACGTDDRLIDINRKLRAWLAAKSIKHVDIETPGYHTWMVWRRNLTEFSSLLFR